LKVYISLLLSLFNSYSFAQETLPLYSNGWIGADRAYTIKLDKQRRLWLFGDTWIGKHDNTKRYDAKVISNSIGIEDTEEKQITYYNGNSDSGFFACNVPKEWYWPMDGVRIGETLYVFLNRLTKTDPKSPFGFKSTGQALAIITNLRNNPDQWNIKYVELPEMPFVLGAALARDDDYLYNYASDHSKWHNIYLARSKISEIKKGILRFDFWSPNGWKNEYKTAKALFSGAPEMSVRFDKQSEEWAAVYSPKGMSRKIVKRKSAKISGLWSSPETIYECPEMELSEKYYCYEGKQLAPMTDESPFSLSYVVNSFDFWDVAKNLKIYVPVVITP
jgi:hypothetical protein